MKLLTEADYLVTINEKSLDTNVNIDDLCTSPSTSNESSLNTSDLTYDQCFSIDESQSLDAETDQITSADASATKQFRIKNRLISVDSGFESIGKTKSSESEENIALECYNIDELDIQNDDTNMETAISETNTEPSPETETKPMNGEQNCDTQKCDIVKEKSDENQVKFVQLDEIILDSSLINQADGLPEHTNIYMDENGSPKVREKYCKKPKTKTAQKKRLTYGTEECIADSFDDEETPSCVSFSKLFHQIKHSFRK